MQEHALRFDGDIDHVRVINFFIISSSYQDRLNKCGLYRFFFSRWRNAKDQRRHSTEHTKALFESGRLQKEAWSYLEDSSALVPVITSCSLFLSRATPYATCSYW